MVAYNVWSFATSFFLLSSHFQGYSILHPVPILHVFFVLFFVLFGIKILHQLMDISVVSIWGLLGTMLLRHWCISYCLSMVFNPLLVLYHFSPRYNTGS